MEPYIQDPQLLQEFLIESEELLQRVDQDLVALESSPTDHELLDLVFRAWHTIKGTAGFFGLEPVVRVGHRAEDVLTNLRNGRIQLTQRIMDALLAARDQLGKMLADIRAGGLKQYSLDALLSELQQVSASSAPEVAVAAAAGVAEPATVAHASQPTPATEPKLAATPVTPKKDNRTVRTLTKQTMRVDVRKLDELVDLIGELVLERNRLVQLTKEVSTGKCDGRGADSPLSHSAARLSFITEELQAAGLRARMVPIEFVFSRFPRLVRDLAHSLQKEVELEIHGQETEIDKTMVELISDPLVHLVRNSLDHGIELPDAREKTGKPRTGKIRLEATQEGDHILILVSDDGAGIDPARILRKAIEKDMVTPERGAALNKHEILELIFLPGFSTVEQATNLSGRGVGMDVVRSNLKKLNGSIDVDSKPGQGTSIFLSLPLTLAILPVLLAKVGEEIYALPLRSVSGTSRFVAGNVHRFEKEEVICLRDQTLPLLRLQKIVDSPGGEIADADKKVVVMADGRRGCPNRPAGG
jgi:two-component system chemotaxis sensor kinase CheA